MGDSVAFIDKVNNPLGLPSRTCKWCHLASQEALCRFYSGIHFLPAVLDGIDQGEDNKGYFEKTPSRRLASILKRRSLSWFADMITGRPINCNCYHRWDIEYYPAGYFLKDYFPPPLRWQVSLGLKDYLIGNTSCSIQ